MTTLKPKNKFYGSASRLIQNGGSEIDVIERSKEFDIKEEEVKVWLQNQAKSKAFGEAMYAGSGEKEAIYNNLDVKFIIEFPQVVVFGRGENQSFYEYKDGVYVLVLEKDMYNMVDALMYRYLLLEHRSSKKRVLDTVTRIGALLSRTPKRHFTDEDILYRKQYLNLKNGLLDMDTFVLSEHTPEYFSTVQVGYEYDPESKCPEFEKFIHTISNENESTALMIQQMYGYSIMQGNPRHKVFYLFGDTARNGKSTAAKILCGLVGWGNVSTLSLQQIANENSSILTSIIGKQINFSDEISSKFIESSRLTAMSAEGIVEINPKYKPSFLYPVRSKFIIACNDLPRFSDFQGMKHRMIAIPFRRHLKESERIDCYDDILLKKEGAGILNWAIEGAKTIKKDGFIINDESKEDIHDNVLQSYPVYAFLETLYDFSSDHIEEIDPKDLYGEHGKKDTVSTGFRLYCEDQGIKTASFPIFTRELKRFANETGKIIQVRSGHRGDRKYIGMKLQSDIDGEREINDVVKSMNI